MAAAAKADPDPELLVCLHGMTSNPKHPATLQLSAAFLDRREDPTKPVLVAVWQTLVRPPKRVRVRKRLRKLIECGDGATLDAAPPLETALESLYLVVERIFGAMAADEPLPSMLQDGPGTAPLHSFDLVASGREDGASVVVEGHAGEWSTVLSPRGEAGADDEAFVALRDAIEHRRRETPRLLMVTDGPWLLGCDLAKQCCDCDGKVFGWKEYMTDFWNFRWAMCEHFREEDAHRMRPGHQMTKLEKSGLSREHLSTYRVRRMAEIVRDLLDRGLVPCINDSLVPNAWVLSRRTVTSPEWYVPKQARLLAEKFPSLHAD